MNTYETSLGERVSQATIIRNLRRAKEGVNNMGDSTTFGVCLCCGSAPVVDCDHTISQKRCKELHKTELIWLEDNWSWSCRKCHEEWESYKSEKFQYHKNFEKRMTFLAIHDYNGFMARFHYVTDPKLKALCELLMFTEED